MDKGYHKVITAAVQLNADIVTISLYYGFTITQVMGFTAHTVSILLACIPKGELLNDG